MVVAKAGSPIAPEKDYWWESFFNVYPSCSSVNRIICTTKSESFTINTVLFINEYLDFIKKAQAYNINCRITSERAVRSINAAPNIMRLLVYM
jgi:hypothetical protein